MVTLLFIIPVICISLVAYLAYRREQQLQKDWQYAIRLAKVYHGYYDKKLDACASYELSKLVNITARRLYNR